LIGLAMKLKKFNVHLYDNKTFSYLETVVIEADGLLSGLVIAKDLAKSKSNVYVGKVEAT
jgi:hypothetical protein